jgi:hypothetical protein
MMFDTNDEALMEQLRVPLPDNTSARGRKRAEQLKRLPGLFVRMPVSWLTKPPRAHVFGPDERLFLYLLFRSHWGQRGAKLTSAFAAEVGVPRRFKNRCVKRWEADGGVRVEREGRGSPTLWPIVIAS